MENLERLRVFQAVSQAESFTKAAELLRLTQSGISQHIKHMEKELGVPLFDREARKVTLTQAGAILYETAKEVLGSIASAERRIQELAGLKGGRLRVGASFPVGVYVLPRVLAAYRKRYPGVEVTLAITTTANIEARVLENKLDFGLVSAEVQHPKLLTLQFMTDELVVIVAADHKWASRRQVKAEDLPGETFILAARGAGARAVVEERLKEKGIALAKTLDFVNAEGVKHAVEAGLGVSIQPRGMVEREVRDGSLKALRLADIDSEIRYIYLRRKNHHFSNAEKAFMEILMNRGS